jgi:MFS superfamily sulfate permease-like transporter
MSRIYQERPWEFWVALLTAATVVLVGVEQGILLAMLLSLLSHTRHGYKPNNTVIVTDQEGWKIKPLATQGQLLPGLMVYRFTHGMYYANAQRLSEEVTRLAEEAQLPLAWFCIEASAVDDIDYTAAETLRNLYSMLHQKGIRLVFALVSPGVMAELGRSGIIDLLNRDSFYNNLGEVVKDYEQKIGTVSGYGKA